LGAGGHARVVADLAALTAGLEIVGVADRNVGSFGEQIGGTKIVTTFADLPRWRSEGISLIALAIGDNVERERMLKEAEAHGLTCATLVHPSAILGTNVVIGVGTVVCAGAIVVTEARVGRGAIVNSGAIVDHETRLGDFSQISPGCRIAGRVFIGDRAFIGTGACVLPCRQIGNDAVVGAGAVVTEDVAAGLAVVGIPARVLRSRVLP
jgi:sugar O-acyltransferase (sialic acid O-acetyltransferase NeuD family)